MKLPLSKKKMIMLIELKDQHEHVDQNEQVIAPKLMNDAMKPNGHESAYQKLQLVREESLHTLTTLYEKNKSAYEKASTLEERGKFMKHANGLHSMIVFLSTPRHQISGYSEEKFHLRMEIIRRFVKKTNTSVEEVVSQSQLISSQSKSNNESQHENSNPSECNLRKKKQKSAHNQEFQMKNSTVQTEEEQPIQRLVRAVQSISAPQVYSKAAFLEMQSVIQMDDMFAPTLSVNNSRGAIGENLVESSRTNQQIRSPFVGSFMRRDDATTSWPDISNNQIGSLNQTNAMVDNTYSMPNNSRGDIGENLVESSRTNQQRSPLLNSFMSPNITTTSWDIPNNQIGNVNQTNAEVDNTYSISEPMIKSPNKDYYNLIAPTPSINNSGGDIGENLVESSRTNQQIKSQFSFMRRDIATTSWDISNNQINILNQTNAAVDNTYSISEPMIKSPNKDHYNMIAPTPSVNYSGGAIVENLVESSRTNQQIRSPFVNSFMRRDIATTSWDIANNQIGILNQTDAAVDNTYSISEPMIKSPNKALLDEIDNLNQQLMETTVVLDKSVDYEVALLAGRGTIIYFYYKPLSNNARINNLPPITLRLLVPVDYPQSTPIILDHVWSAGQFDLSEMTKERLKLSTRMISSPMTVFELAITWESTARGVVLELA